MDKQSLIKAGQRVFEIEAAAVKQLSHQLTDDFAGAVRAILECPGKVVVCGMGKSGHIGRKIAATLASTGTPSFFLHPAEAFHGDLGMVTPQDVFIGISNSGETEEVIRLISALKANHNSIIAICGQQSSTLVRNANFFLNVAVEKEACPLKLAPTSSTTATLAMGDALAIALMEERGFQPENFAMFHPGGSLGRKLLTKVKDVMFSKNLPFVSTTTNFKNLILTMSEGKLGMAIVLTNGKIAGVVTDGDLRRGLEKFENPTTISVKDIMTPQPKTVSPDEKLSEAEKLLVKHKITSLIVAEEDHPIGVLQLYALENSANRTVTSS